MEEIHCSSDADSLDGVVLPRSKVVLLDATPPHALEPQFPGAVEQPFSLCDCWDTAQLSAAREPIVALGEEIAGLHRQAVRYLAGAAALLGEVRQLAAASLDQEKIARYADRFAARELPDRGRPGTEERRLLSAVTDRGCILYNETLQTLCPRLRETALQRGHHIVSCPCPLFPNEKLDHLLLPELGLGIVTSNSFHRITTPGRAVHAQRFTDGDLLKSRRVRIRFLQKTAAVLLRQAELAIAEAHTRHDALEAYYIAATDFTAVNALSDRLLRELDDLL